MSVSPSPEPAHPPLSPLHSGSASNSPKQSAHSATGTMRLGSRSPSSIPSSPTSVHSSSSAIFERDIEPLPALAPPTSHSHPPNPHRIPRAKTTEQLELSVPSVLDSAAAILASPSASSKEDANNIGVITPANGLTGRRSGFVSPIGSSRSPSPSTSAANRNSLVLTSVPLSFPPPFLAPKEMSSSPPRPAVQTAFTSPHPIHSDAPSLVTPTTAYFSTASAESSPTTTTCEHPPQPIPIAIPRPVTTVPTLSHPPSPTQAYKRLSFLAYSDLLISTPASLQPLSSLTTSASTADPPPHIPSVSGFNTHTTTSSAAASIHHWEPGTASSMEDVGQERDSIALLDDVGGEWEREGFGGGLEKRLETALGVTAHPALIPAAEEASTA